MTNSDGHKKAMIAALRKTLGNVTEACKIVDIARQTHYRWLTEDAEYKQTIEDIGEEALDFVESKLLEKVGGVLLETGKIEEGASIVYKQVPSDTAIIFYLKTKGKKRGYVERNEIAGVVDQPLVTKSDEDLIQILRELSAKLTEG